MPHRNQQAAQPQPFDARTKHYANTQRGLATYQCENNADRATVKALLRAAVKAGSAQ